MDRQLDRSPHSRRTFLKVATAGGVGAGIAGGLAALGAKYGPAITADDEQRKLTTVISAEGLTLLADIVKYRNALGLAGWPGELKSIKNHVEWNEEAPLFQNNLPEQNKSYGDYISEVMTKLFGKAAGRLVKEVEEDKAHPFGISFKSGERSCQVSHRIHEIPIEDGFLDYILHEAAGHGSDPALSLSYPAEMLIRVEHGKWQALSQAMSIKDQFFNHPGDRMMPYLQTKVGERVAKALVFSDDTENPIADINNRILMLDEVELMARERRIEVPQIKFNKAFCRELGERLIRKLRRNEIGFAGELKQLYGVELEGSLGEIYAEMVKYALVYPDQIGHNKYVLAGIAEVFSAVNGEQVQLEEIRKAIASPSESILERNQAEKAAISPVLPTAEVPVPTLTPEELAELARQKAEFERREAAYRTFFEQGILPDTVNVSQSDAHTLSDYAHNVHLVAEKYPRFYSTFAQHINQTFDPQLHIWEIHTVEQSMNSGFIRKITDGEPLTPADVNDAKLFANALRQFLVSSAFGT